METNSTNPNEDLQAIREIMERSSKFLSLSGLSGIFAGVCALIGAAIETIDRIVSEVERELRGGDSVEIESKKIGQIVANKLKKIDKVAYIRFSSVFRRFVDVEDFEKEVKRLIK